jgi:hypothetical protein
MEQIIQSPELRRKLSQLARKRASGAYDVSNTTRALMTAMSTALTIPVKAS